MRGRFVYLIVSAVSLLFAGRPDGDVISRMYNDAPKASSRIAKQGSTVNVSPSVKVKKTRPTSVKRDQ